MHPHVLTAVLCLPLLWLHAPGASADRLSRAGRSLRDSSSDDSDHHDHRRKEHRRHYEADNDNDEDEAVEAAALLLLLLPWKAPRAVLHASHPDWHGAPPIPYLARPQGTGAPFDSGRSYRLLVHTFGAAYNKNLGSAGLEIQLDLALPFALRAQGRALFERNGDHAQLYEQELLWRFAEGPRVQWYTGLAALQWHDAYGTVGGVGLSYGLEWQPGAPITLGTRLSLAAVAEQSYIFQWRTHVGLMLGPVEPLVAYDHLDVGGVILSRMLVGVRLHL